MGRCFVIQPFDNDGPFDRRFEDTIAPAIKAADLEPYRVDRDHSTEILIDDIHTQIREATAVLADITTDNPNVWYELGLAIGAHKPLVMVCSDARARFPFDVQHRHVIRYRTQSRSDFDTLADNITARLKAAVSRDERLQVVAQSSRLADVQGLSQHEIVALVIVAENTHAFDDEIAASEVLDNMRRAGYEPIAVRLATAQLIEKRMIQAKKRVNEQHDYEYVAFAATPAGMDWLIRNQDKLRLRHDAESARKVTIGGDDSASVPEDDIPF